MSQEWFRSWRNAPKDEKWLAVAAEAGVPRSLVVAVVWCLLDHGGSRPYAERGSVAAINTRVLAAWLECSADEIERIMAALIDFGFMTETTITHWDQYQPIREDNSAERTRGWRARKKAANGSDPHPPGGLHEPKQRNMKRDVTRGDAKVTPRDAPESESDAESEKESSSARARERPTMTTTDDFYKFGKGLLASLGEPEPDTVLDALLRKHHGKVQWALAKLRHLETARHQKRYYERLRDELVLIPREAASASMPVSVFVVEDSPAWLAWKERRKGSPPVTQLGRKRGWYFPTEYPPPLEVTTA